MFLVTTSTPHALRFNNLSRHRACSTWARGEVRPEATPQLWSLALDLDMASNLESGLGSGAVESVSFFSFDSSMLVIRSERVFPLAAVAIRCCAYEY
jgi:hypothetical protein